MKDVEGLLDSCTVLLDVEVRIQDSKFSYSIFHCCNINLKGAPVLDKIVKMPESDSIIKTEIQLEVGLEVSLLRC